MPGEGARKHTVLLLGVAVVMLFFRRPDAFIQPQLFVEDGTVFFRDDHELGLAALTKPYAGYLHLLPRLIALAAGVFPIEWRPRLYVLGCLLVMLLIACRTLQARVELPSRWAFALCPLVFPIGPFIFLHLTNIQWFAAILLLLLLLARPAENARQIVADVAIAAVSGLSGPFAAPALLLVPVRLHQRGFDRRDLPLYGTLVLACAVQGHFLLQAKSLSGGGFEHANVGFLATHGARYLLGDVAIPMLKHGREPIALVLAAVLIAVPLLARGQRHAALLIGGFAFAIGLMGLYRMAPEAGGANAFRSGIRYFFWPHLGATYLLLLGVVTGGRLRALTAPLLLLALLSATTRFTYRAPAPHKLSDYADRIRSGKPVVVPLQPRGWRMRLN